MDDIIMRKRSDVPTAGFPVIVLVAVCLICIAAGFRFAEDLGFAGISFYSRYEGIAQSDVGMFVRLREAVFCSVPCFLGLTVLLICSFSPMILPASGIIIGLRGLLLGSAICLAQDMDSVMQICTYGVCTGIICITSVSFMIYRREAFPKIKAFLAASGGCVLCEVLLSFIL